MLGLGKRGKLLSEAVNTLLKEMKLHPFLFDTCGLASQFTHVVQSPPSDLTPGHDLYLIDRRGMKRKDPFHTDSVRHLANRKGRACCTFSLADDKALKYLYPFLLTLFNPGMDLDGVTGFKIGGP